MLFQPTSRVALPAQAAADACLAGLLKSKLFSFQGEGWLSGAPL